MLWRSIIIVLIWIGLLIAGGMMGFEFEPPLYQSRALLQMSQGLIHLLPSPGESTEQSLEKQRKLLSRETYAQLLQQETSVLRSDRLLLQAIGSSNWPTEPHAPRTLEQVRQCYSVVHLQRTELITLTCCNEDPRVAQQMNHAIIETYLADVEQRKAESTDVAKWILNNMRVMSKGDLPIAPYRDRGRLYGLVGGIAGFGVGLIVFITWLVVELSRRKKINN